MNRGKFYSYLRSSTSDVFGSSLSKRQVTALESLLDECKGLPLDHASHVLSEVYHETGGGMYPVKETVFSYSKDKNPSDQRVIARLESNWLRGNLPWVATPYWRDGWFGRGGIQITHKANYMKLGDILGVDLVSSPDLALDPIISARIAVIGCSQGEFTGAKLSDYEGPDGFDHYNARSIVNGDKKANGERVEAYAFHFTKALKVSGWSEETPLTKPRKSDKVKDEFSLWHFVMDVILNWRRKDG